MQRRAWAAEQPENELAETPSAADAIAAPPRPFEEGDRNRRAEPICFVKRRRWDSSEKQITRVRPVGHGLPSPVQRHVRTAFAAPPMTNTL
jgi:hypothetical protein